MHLENRREADMGTKAEIAAQQTGLRKIVSQTKVRWYGIQVEKHPGCGMMVPSLISGSEVV